jgi:hypothetical protein
LFPRLPTDLQLISSIGRRIYPVSEALNMQMRGQVYC